MNGANTQMNETVTTISTVDLQLLELKRLSMQTQTVIFTKKDWTIAKAKSWLSNHKMRSDKVDETANTYRFRQFDPSRCQGQYATLTENMPRGITMVVCKAQAGD